MALIATAAAADPCPGRPDALGTSRTIVLDPTAMHRVGTHDYGRTLPLAHREVVLTFDDGPLLPTTERVLDALDAHCVKAVFFLVGRNARHAPHVVRRILAAGHTIGTHTQNHPMHAMGRAEAIREIDAGIASVKAALGDPNALAPFFRFPGLYHPSHAERHLRAQGLAAWSIDIDSYDWKHSTPKQVLDSLLARLDAKGRGILLMHDIQAKTARFLPTLLVELKRRGYRVVHVVPPRPPAAAETLTAQGPAPPAETTGAGTTTTAVVAAAPAAVPLPMPRPSGLVAAVPPDAAEATGPERQAAKRPARTRTAVALPDPHALER